MQSLLSRRGAAVALIAGLLVTAAGAQDQPARPKLQDRDPFINQLTRPSQTTHVRPTHVRNQDDPAVQPTKVAQPTRDDGAVALEAPLVKVTGIIESKGKKSAILNDGQKSRIVSVGQRLADYQITAISKDRVTFTCSGQNFEIPMESEF